MMEAMATLVAGDNIFSFSVTPPNAGTFTAAITVKDSQYEPRAQRFR